MEAESLYIAIQEWVLFKETNQNISDVVIIDDTDTISSADAFNLLLEFYHICNHTIQASIFRDIYMLVKWNTKNINFLLENTFFTKWIL